MTLRKRPAALETPATLVSLETATEVCGVALLREDVVLCSISFAPAGGHSASLMPAVDAVARLSGSAPGTWRAVAVSVGPGSFTGLRIGLSTAKALGLGLGIPVYGVPTLPALARRLPAAEGDLVCPLLDARKGQLFAALYRWRAGLLEEVLPPSSLFPEELPHHVPQHALFTGDGLRQHGPRLTALYGAPLRTAPLDLCLPDPISVGRLAQERIRGGDAGDGECLVPLYVRPSDAELTHGAERALSNKCRVDDRG